VRPTIALLLKSIKNRFFHYKEAKAMDYSCAEVSMSFDSDAYQLQEKIGQGGFGQVFKAIQLSTNQAVAIKFLTLRPEFDDDKKRRYVERFEREMQLVSRLQHPNIVRLLDKVWYGDLQHAVFEYVDGQTLKDILQESGALPPTAAVEIMLQVLDALTHAHENGVIHRDLKPANIMLSKTGAKIHAKILDFGIGSLTKEARQLEYKTITLTQETFGTPSYCAPEQLRGEPPTPKTDIYVWGLVFLECLTGHPTISGASLASIFHKQLSPSNIALPPTVAGHPVAELLRKVLSKKASERSGNTADIYLELTKINFLTLAGDLQSKATNVKNQPIEDMKIEGDETIISDTGLHYNGLTEKKQISVLVVLLSIQPISGENINYEICETLHQDQKSQCVDIAIRYGAFHAGTLADTLLFYFGYPAVSDNDSRLCARTALDISSSLNQRNSKFKQEQGFEIAAHMGMHTGIVTVYADFIPEGSTVNIAMNLARCALPKQILCSDVSKNRLESNLNFKPIDVSSPSSNQQAVASSQLIGEDAAEAFSFLKGSGANYDFIGRESELAQLKNLLNVGHNNGLVAAHVYGEAGIGKSRLIFEIRKLAKSFRQSIAQCLPEQKFCALYPILNVLKHKYSLDILEPKNAVQCLSNILSSNNRLDANFALPLLCSWLHLPLPVDFLKTPPPKYQKQTLFEALITLLINDDQNHPEKKINLFIIEDIHWVDPVTIEFIDYALNHQPSIAIPTVLITTSRQLLPEELAHFEISTIEITGLETDKIDEFITSIFDKQNVSNTVLQVVRSRTDGIPLFIEELINMLQTKDLLQNTNGIVDFVDLNRLDEVPETLLDSLQQKLDTLVYAKNTAQLAAAIGRKFNYALLVSASKYSESQVQTDLNELIEKQLIYKQRKVSDDSYIFRHALVRDAAYDSATKDIRQSMHRLIADAIQRIFEDDPDIETQSLLAHHNEKAGDMGKALTLRTALAKSLCNNGTGTEAIHHIEKAFAYIPDIPDISENGPKLDSIEIDLRYNLSIALASTKGYACNELINNYKRMIQLTETEELFSKMFLALYSTSLYYMVSCDHENCKKTLKLIETKGGCRIRGNYRAMMDLVYGHLYSNLGDKEKAIRYYKTAMESYSSVEPDFDYSILSVDFVNIAYTYCALDIYCYGTNPEAEVEADAHMETAYRSAYESENKENLAHHLARRAQYFILKNNTKLVLENAISSLAISEKYNYAPWTGLALCCKGWGNCMSNNGGWLDDFEMGYSTWSVTGDNTLTAWLKTLLAECHLKDSNLKMSKGAILESNALYKKTQSRQYLSYFEKVNAKVYRSEMNSILRKTALILLSLLAVYLSIPSALAENAAKGDDLLKRRNDLSYHDIPYQFICSFEKGTELHSKIEEGIPPPTLKKIMGHASWFYFIALNSDHYNNDFFDSNDTQSGKNIIKPLLPQWGRWPYSGENRRHLFKKANDDPQCKVARSSRVGCTGYILNELNDEQLKNKVWACQDECLSPIMTRIDHYEGYFSGLLLDQAGLPVLYESRGNPLLMGELANYRSAVAIKRPYPLDLQGGQCGTNVDANPIPSRTSEDRVDMSAPISIKIAWKILTSEDDESRYVTVSDIEMPDLSQYNIELENIALENKVTLGIVGMHIALKQQSVRGWQWITFEHIDNLNENIEGALPNKNFSSGKDQQCENSFVVENGKIQKAELSRTEDIDKTIMEVNNNFRDWLKNKNSVLQYYILVGTQKSGTCIKDNNCKDDKGNPLPLTENLRNTTLEPYFVSQSEECEKKEVKKVGKFEESNCAGCHYKNTQYPPSSSKTKPPMAIMQAIERGVDSVFLSPTGFTN
jgi:TOMM system kinase/cyclase fusion protein